MTYSIVACDAETGELGAALQSASFRAGGGCIWALSGVGAVATQSFSDRGYGPLGLELMRAGKTPQRTLAALLEADEQAPYRQVGMVDVSGEAAVHTGDACIAEAGHVAGDGFSVQANMMASRAVWPAMAEAFGAAAGTLAERLLAALEAAQAAGGDWRGQQAGALLVVAGEHSGRPWDDRVSDLRVDDHPQPLAELRRLLRLEQGLRRIQRIGPGASVEEEVAAVEAAGLGEPYRTWAAVAVARDGGDVEEARRLFEALLAREPRYVEVARRLPGFAELLGLEPPEWPVPKRVVR